MIGVDLSSWQGKIDYDKLASQVDFAFVRAGCGNTYHDPRCNEYRKGLRQVNVPFGLYWFVSPGKDFRKHALSFCDIWSDDPGQLSPVFDIEETGGLTKSKLESWLRKMYDAFYLFSELELKDTITYTSPGFLNKALPLTNWMKLTQLWVAHWTRHPHPIIPEEWRVPGKDWRFWQYTNLGVGSDFGVSSAHVDIDRINGELLLTTPAEAIT